MVLLQKDPHLQINNPIRVIFLIMKKYFLHFMVGALLLASNLLSAQTPVGGWLIENIHGPSQVGIVDSIPVDINQDGFMDVVSASIDDGHLRAYINQGSSQDLVKPSFKQLYISKEVPGIYRVSATDINDDGEVDFLVSSIETHEVIALINDPNSQPFGYRKVVIAKSVLLPTDAQAGDFNNDGLMDVVSVSFELNAVYLHLQNEAGEFATTTLSESTLRPRKIQVENYTNDFQMDFIVASSEDNAIRLFVNQGQGTFQEQLISDQMTGTRFVAQCDADGNNLIDFVASATTDNMVYLYTNLGDGKFSEQVAGVDLPGVNAIHCADIDNDNQDELISIASQVGNIYTQELNGSNKQLIANTRDGYVSVKTAVFETNGPRQILTQAYFESRNLLYQANQANQESVVWEDFPDGAYYVTSGDIDNDGDIDAVIASFRDNRVYWLERNKHYFTPREISTIVDGPQSVIAGDIDNDYDLDVVTAGAWDNSFWLHKNDGFGVFETSLIFDSAFNAARVSLADMNKDGLLDLVASSSLDNSVRLFIQQEKGFSEQLIDSDLIGAYDIDVADFNNDGFFDILGSGLRDSNINLYINNGLNEYNLDTVYHAASSTNSVDVADIDANGLPDISLIKDGSIINLLNKSNLFFDLVDPIINLEAIRDFLFVKDEKINGMVFIGLSETGDLHIIDFSSVKPVYTRLDNQFRARSVVIDGPNRAFYSVSNVDNSVKWIFQDIILKDNFEDLMPDYN